MTVDRAKAKAKDKRRSPDPTEVRPIETPLVPTRLPQPIGVGNAIAATGVSVASPPNPALTGNSVAAHSDQAEARRAPPPPHRHASTSRRREVSHPRAHDEAVVAHVHGSTHRRAAWREGASHLPMRRPGSILAKPIDLPYPPIAGPLPCEADISDWLSWDIQAGDRANALERDRRLAMIFKPLVSPYREALKARLRADSKTDQLAHLFFTRVSAETRGALTALLDGTPKPLALVDPASMPSFVEGVTPQSIHVDPEPVFDPESIRVGQESPLVIDSEEMPAATAAITIEGTVAPPSPTTIVWSIHDAARRELVREEALWKNARSEPLRTAFDTLGSYTITVRIVDSEGLLVTSAVRGFQVVESELDQLRALSETDLRAKWRELHQAVSDGVPPAGLDRLGLQLKLSQVEWVATERNIDVKVVQVGPMSDLLRQMTTLDGGIVLADTPEQIRIQLEADVAKRGTVLAYNSIWRSIDAIDRYEQQTRGVESDAAKRPDILKAQLRIHWAYDAIQAIQTYNAEFVGWFEAAAWGVLEKTLTTSEAGAAAARRAYGVFEIGRVDSADDRVAQEKARAELVTVAGEMGLSKAKVEEAEGQYSAELMSQYQDRSELSPAEKRFGRIDGHEIWERKLAADLADPSDPDALRRVAAMKPVIAKRDTARKQYDALFAQRAQRYPILGAYREAKSEDFKKITAANVLDDIIEKTYEVDKNIAKVRDRLHDHAYELWKLDNVIHSTEAALHVAPGSMQARAIEEKISDADPWWHSALTWVGVGLALAAAPFTGGSSLAIAAELAGLALTAVQLGVDVQEYKFGKAAAHTDLDTIRGLASTEPSLLPVIMDLVAAGLQLSSVIKAFRAAAKLRRLAALASKTDGAEAQALVKELDALGQKTLGRSIGTEIEADAVRAAKAEPYEKELAKALEGRPGATLNAKVRPLDDNAFFVATGSDSGNAAVVFRRNVATGKLEPEILVREGSDLSVVRAEAAHLDQAADPKMADLIEQLDEEKLTGWSTLGRDKKMASVRAKLELEIDAQKRVISELGAKQSLTDAERLRLDNAWGNIDNLRGQFEQWGALENAGGAATADAAVLDKPPRLFDKPTTTEVDALEIATKAKDEADFIKQYRDLHPSSRLTDDELKLRFDSGKKINPESGFLHDPSRRAPRKPGVTADIDKTKTKHFTTGSEPPQKGWQKMELSPEGQQKRDAFIAERDAARSDRDALLKGKPPDETGAAKAGARVNEASRKIGDLHADEYMAKHHSDYDKIYPPPGAKSRSGDFDQVWRRFKMVDGKKQYLDDVEVIIIEAKGGAGKLGVKRVGDKIVEQGSAPYFDAITSNMKQIDFDTWTALSSASPRKTTYLLVHAPIESGAPSIADTILVDEFNLGKK